MTRTRTSRRQIVRYDKRGEKRGEKFKISREKFSARREGNRSKDDDTAEHEPKTR